MKDIPMLFKPEMIAAVDEDRKTQTRRMSTRAKVGDQLWIKEVHYKWGRFVKTGAKTKTGKDKIEFVHMPYRFNMEFPNFSFNRPLYITENKLTEGWHERSPLFMEKRYARKWLMVTGVRVEHLHDISEDDAIAEGIDMDTDHAELCLSIQDAPYCNNLEKGSAIITVFKKIWDSINGNDEFKCWAANPMVKVIDFERVTM